jgi:TetR/AcrR family transcriptional repressor of bet genes
MGKRSIKTIRRDELMEAAIDVLGTEGLSGATMAVIASRAGMSTGLVNHYFESKEELLALAMRNLSNLFRRGILDLMPPDPTPQQRLKAIIDGSFRRSISVARSGKPGCSSCWPRRASRGSSTSII